MIDYYCLKTVTQIKYESIQVWRTVKIIEAFRNHADQFHEIQTEEDDRIQQ